jgi:hypothetical protein
VAAVRDHLLTPDLSVAVIGFGTPEDHAAYHRHLQLPFPLLSDPDRELYRRFGFGVASLRAIYGAGTLRLYARLLRRGRRLRRPRQDTRQLGGDVVIDPLGRLVAVFRPASPDDRPTLDQLARALQQATR